MLGICFPQEKNNKSIPKDFSTVFQKNQLGGFLLHKELSISSNLH